MSHFYLYGPSGAGKTTVGRLLADRLALPFHDLDHAVEQAAGAEVSGIFSRQGEAAFRQIEREQFALLAAGSGPAVIALGGGSLLDPASRDLACETGRVLCLRAEVETLGARLAAGGPERPLLSRNPAENLPAYLERRSAHYASFERQLDTTGLSPTEAASAASRAFGAFRVTGMGEPYDVRVERGLLDRIPQMMRDRSLAGPYALVADTNTALYARRVAEHLTAAGKPPTLLEVEAGESSKTIGTIERLWSGFLEAGLERGSTVLAVGGGVVCDLAGFAAATFLRGVAWAALPTSLLAMVDASLGGKTGIDLPQGKNLAGAFHPPRLVAVDPDALATLPDRELRSGLAEVVKAAVLGDPDLFDRCAAWAGGEVPDDWIARSMDVKIRVIAADPFERGLRAVLNFGHTIGHAVEHASGYRLSHGEAVAIGMAVETRLAEELGAAPTGLAVQISGCLERIGLPVRIPPELDRAKILSTLSVDKKQLGGRLRFALPERIGEVRIVEVDPELISKHLQL